MSEGRRVRAWLRTTLAGDATLTSLLGPGNRIHHGSAPQGTGYPFIVFHDQSGMRDVMEASSTRIMATGLWTIKAVLKGTDDAALELIMKRVDVLLHGASGNVTGATILTCVREGTQDLPHTEDGVQYQQMLAFYRIRAQET